MEFIQQEIPLPCAHPSTDLHSLASDDPLISYLPSQSTGRKRNALCLISHSKSQLINIPVWRGKNYRHLRRGYVIQLVLMETVSLGACQR